MSSFSWPVTDEELLLTQVLEDVLLACDARGKPAEARIAAYARSFIAEAYEVGVRDRATIAEYAVREMLRLGQRT